jgi:hypothetical protein
MPLCGAYCVPGSFDVKPAPPMNDVPNSLEGDLKQDRAAYAGSAWFLWGLGLLANTLVVFLWVVFGLAAAAGADSSWFVARTAAAVIVSLLGSGFALWRQQRLVGVVLMWAMIPLIFLFVGW